MIPDSTPRVGHRWLTGSGGGPPTTPEVCYLGYCCTFLTLHIKGKNHFILALATQKWLGLVTAYIQKLVALRQFEDMCTCRAVTIAGSVRKVAFDGRTMAGCTAF